MEGLEKRQLLAGLELPTNLNLDPYTSPRNVGAVQSFTFIESETLAQSGLNDYYLNADFVPLGNGPGQRDTIDVTGSMAFTSFPNDPFSFGVDIDTFAFDLQAGDILDIATLGTAGTIDVSYSNGTNWFATDVPQAVGYPPDSPLQTLGNNLAAHVVPEDGRYFLSVSPIDTTANYTLGLRTYRPLAEQLPLGAHQVIFLDFDGGRLPNSLGINTVPGIPTPGLQRYPSLQESLPLLGIDQFDTVALNQMIDRIVDEVEFHYDSVARTGGNGDFESTGINGQYKVTILNSRDHLDPGTHPLVTRVLIGGDSSIPGIPVNGFSTTLDVGNFSMDDTVVTVIDGAFTEAQLFPRSNRESLLTAIAVRLSSTISHEAAHSFGIRHTNNLNNVGTVIDAGGSLTVVGQRLGVGPDGIFGTLDDVRITFKDDQFDPGEGYFGINRVVNALSYTLATGGVGGGITGRVFRDANRDGSGASDIGLGGVTVFADVNGNGVADPNEPTDITSVNGSYSLSVAAGTVNVIAVPPINFVPTTPGSVSTNVSLGGTASVSFGLSQVISNITGMTFADSDGDGLRDPGEGGVEGVYTYLDSDGDNLPDLGETATHTAADGSYSLNFPGPGTYTIRQVLPLGFEQSFPLAGEHTVFFDGGSLSDNFNFGLLPSQDFGDAPDSYGTLTSSNGASHGIAAGLTIGSIVDREIDGQPSLAADGDDLNGDDESGIRLLGPLGLGSAATFEATVTNTTGTPAFLQAFIDFDLDGNFLDPGEQFQTNVSVPSGSVNSIIPLVVSVPAGAAVGTTYARFRLSQSSGLGPTGFAATGEVEDYSFQVLSAAKLANDDEEFVSRNSGDDPSTLSIELDVLRNDFQTIDNPLTIESLNIPPDKEHKDPNLPLPGFTEGIVVIAADGKSVFYTPKVGFIGRDVFGYTVVDQFGNRSTASVVVNVSFQSNIPIAIDDIFEVPEGSANRALNVLDNDLPSTFGGLSITSVSGGSSGGTLTIIGGGQSLRYTPPSGFNGTEQFTYSVQDAIGTTSSAIVTVNLLPGSRGDDVVDFTIGIFDPINTNTPVTNVYVGQDILVRVSVEDIRPFASPEGVASAFLDLLYTDVLVTTLNEDDNSDFPFDIKFGELFSPVPDSMEQVFQTGNAQVPGLIDEVGGVQRLSSQQPHNGPVELFTLTMRAVSPGVAVFTADPADSAVSETAVIGSDSALTPSQLRLGRTELLIELEPASGNFTSAIDDSFPEGRDSDGNSITSTSAARSRLDVIDNDNLGPTGTVREFGLVTSPTLGNVMIDDNGTPSNLNDDFFSYRRNANSNGLEQFTYLIVTDDNIRSTAEVTIALGNGNDNLDVALDFALVSGDDSGTPISSVSVGQRFGVQIIGEALGFGSSVFAGFLDVLYDTGIIQPGNLFQGDDYDFDVQFEPPYAGVRDAGTSVRPGIIDEFGAVAPSGIQNSRNVLATLFFDAVNVGTTNVVGSPADTFPDHDTLLLNVDDPIPVSRIRYDSLQINVTSGTPQQNASLPQDVNNDGFVSTIDALLIINEMSRMSFSAEGQYGGSILASKYYDVNGNGVTSASDALQVINYLARGQINAEGEAVAQQLPSNATDLAVDRTDVVFADLKESKVAKIAATGASVGQASLGSVITTAGGDADDEDHQDHLLDLLAEDVSGLWS